jgi:Mrp family chromosome partitioning ATPase
MPPDDVAALLTRVELDRSQYKVFEGRSGQSESVVTYTSAQPMARMRSHEVMQQPEYPSQNHEAGRPRWNVLSSLLGTKRAEHEAVEPASLLVPMLAVSAGSGGAGKSTILSSMARLLSAMGESIFVVYSSAQRSLPLHFVGQQVVPGRVRTLIPPGRDCGHLHLYAHAEDGSDENRDLGRWLPRQVNALASEVGRVLCEVSDCEIAERPAMQMAAVNLRMLVPDINSVLAVNRDLREAPYENMPFYLLNKYDGSVPFHRDVRERLSEVLGERLLPFTIRRTDQFAEALASGLTVMDYAPTAPVVDDLKLLAQWVRNSMGSNDVRPLQRIL